jgi:hypothetical protein
LIGTPLTKELNNGEVPIHSIIDRLYKPETTKRSRKGSRLALLDASQADERNAILVKVQPEPPPPQ